MKLEKKTNRGIRARQSVYFTLTVVAAVFGISAILVVSAIAGSGFESTKVNNVKASVMAPAVQEESSDSPVVSKPDDAQTAGPQVKYGQINEDDINFRAEPSTSSKVICILPYGSQHLVAEEDNNGWTCLVVEGVGTGYVASEYVDIKTGAMKAMTDEDRRAIARGVENAAAYEAQLNQWLEETSEEADETEETADYQEEPVEVYDDEDYSSEEDYVSDDYYYFDYQENNWEQDDDSWYEEDDEWYEEDYEWYPQENYDEDEYSDNNSYWEEDDDNYEEDNGPEISYADSLRAQVVDYACSFAGWLPYVWGGHSLTTGADCSGFMAAIYAEFGYNLSYSSDVMSYQGRSVSLSEAKPGDIIVYPGHVTMYIGNGMKVHSPYPGTTVTIDSIYYEPILDVRRIIED